MRAEAHAGLIGWFTDENDKPHEQCAGHSVEEFTLREGRMLGISCLWCVSRTHCVKSVCYVLALPCELRCDVNTHAHICTHTHRHTYSHTHLLDCIINLLCLQCAVVFCRLMCDMTWQTLKYFFNWPCEFRLGSLVLCWQHLIYFLLCITCLVLIFLLLLLWHFTPFADLCVCFN